MVMVMVMVMVWVITEEVVQASFLSELEIGDVVLKAALTTTLQRMSTACDVVLLARALQ